MLPSSGCVRNWAAAERTIDIPAIIAAAQSAPALEVPADDVPGASATVARIGVARDAAFNFYYDANLRWLRQWGAEVVEFSPLEDPELPADVDGLYLGGGFPECSPRGFQEMSHSWRRCAERTRPACPSMLSVEA